MCFFKLGFEALLCYSSAFFVGNGVFATPTTVAKQDPFAFTG